MAEMQRRIRVLQRLAVSEFDGIDRLSAFQTAFTATSYFGFRIRFALRLPSSVAGTSVGIICFDHADEHIQKSGTLGFRQGRQQALLGRQQRGTQAAAQVSASRGDIELSSPPIFGIDLSLDETLPFEHVDHLAEVHRVNSHAICSLLLAASRGLLDRRHYTPEQWGQIFGRENLSRDTEADLMKAPGQMSRHPVRGQD
jgi:hypothetical protein